jgi:hypothetical protein
MQGFLAELTQPVELRLRGVVALRHRRSLTCQP